MFSNVLKCVEGHWIRSIGPSKWMLYFLIKFRRSCFCWVAMLCAVPDFLHLDTDRNFESIPLYKRRFKSPTREWLYWNEVVVFKAAPLVANPIMEGKYPRTARSKEGRHMMIWVSGRWESEPFIYYAKTMSWTSSPSSIIWPSTLLTAANLNFSEQLGRKFNRIILMSPAYCKSQE